MRNPILALALLCTAFPALADWSEPARGSALRSALADAARPHAEWMLGAPVEFVINDLRVSGKVGFGAFQAQRPGGGGIDMADTPMVTRDGMETDYLDGPSMQVLYKRSGDTWVAVHWQIGATDVWYAWDAYCPEYRDVIPENCP